MSFPALPRRTVLRSRTFRLAMVLLAGAALEGYGISACSLSGLDALGAGWCGDVPCDAGSASDGSLPPGEDGTAPSDGSPPGPDASKSDAGDATAPRDGSKDTGVVDTGVPDTSITWTFTPDVDGSAWGGRAPAVPLVVRGPYVSTWMASDSPGTTWPTFWNGIIKGFTCMVRVDANTQTLIGNPIFGTGTTSITPPPATVTSHSMTATTSQYVFAAAGSGAGTAVAITLDFISPVEVTSLQRQSAPVAYVVATATSTDGNPHTVSIYFDISGEWAYGNTTENISWARESVPIPEDGGDGDGGTLIVQTFTPTTPSPLTEVNNYAAWGNAFLAASASSQLTVAIGEDTLVRYEAYLAGELNGQIDSNMPREIMTEWPVLGFNFNFGSIPSGSSQTATIVLGHVRDPAVSYLGTSISSLWKSYWPTWEAMAADEYGDAPNAIARAAALDTKVASDAFTAGGAAYQGLVTLALRQAYGATELVGTPSQPWAFLKEISSSGNVSTVDVIYPASPAFLYTNPLYLKMILDPILAYAEAPAPDGGSLWPQPFAPHDLGTSYPNATGYPTGGGENMPVEESANMLIMMAAYVQHASPADGAAYATAHYAIAKKWVSYLLGVPSQLPDPGCQNQTDDFTGYICHSANLALKGIVGVGAMSILAKAAGNANDQAAYLAEAVSLANDWPKLAQSTTGNHLLLEYDEGDAGLGFPVEDSWSLKYNALYDRILGLNLISGITDPQLPAPILTEEAAWYLSNATLEGVILDDRNAYTKSDWELFVAGAVDDPTTRQYLINGVYNYATTTPTRIPFSDWYCVTAGANTTGGPSCASQGGPGGVMNGPGGFAARPVQGGMFSILARGPSLSLP